MLLRTVLLLVTFIVVAVRCDDVVEDVLDQAQETYDDAKDAIQDTKDYAEGKNDSDSGNQTSSEEDLPGLSRQNDNGEVINNNNNNNIATGGGAMCRMCAVTKNLDNVVTLVYDRPTKTEESSVYGCPNYQCAANQDWCLVTHMYYRASGDKPERKVEEYHCGNKDQIRTDDYCRDQYAKTTNLNIIVSCETKRSSSQSTAASLLAILLSVLVAVFH